LQKGEEKREGEDNNGVKSIRLEIGDNNTSNDTDQSVGLEVDIDSPKKDIDEKDRDADIDISPVV
jgi:hypothetical protein